MLNNQNSPKIIVGYFNLEIPKHAGIYFICFLWPYLKAWFRLLIAYEHHKVSISNFNKIK